MNRISIFFVAAAGVLGSLVLTSCESFNPFSKSKKITTATVLPTDRERIQQHQSHQQYSSEDIAAGAVKGDWAIEEVYGRPVVAQTPPFLKFAPAEKRVYGNNGCNVLNAEYTVNSADSTLSFTNPVTTMRMCDKAGITDIDINVALANTKRYTWERRGDEYYLYLVDNAGQPMLTLMHQNFEFLNGEWQVTTIGEEEIDNPDVVLVIDVDEGKLHGNTGCNVLNGTFDVDLETANTISFQDIITTRMACPDPEYQTRFIVALEDADHAKPISADTVLLLNSSNEVVLTLKKI